MKRTKLTLVTDQPIEEVIQPIYSVNMDTPQYWRLYQERFPGVGLEFRGEKQESDSELLMRAKYLRAAYWLFRNDSQS